MSLDEFKKSLIGLTGFASIGLSSLTGCFNLHNIDNLNESKINYVSNISLESRLYEFGCDGTETRSFYHIRQAHYVKGVDEFGVKKISDIQKSIYDDFILPVMSKDSVAFFNEGYAVESDGGLEQQVKLKVLEMYDSNYVELKKLSGIYSAREKELFSQVTDLSLSEEERNKKLKLLLSFGDEPVKLVLKINDIETSDSYKKYYEQNPFLFGALNYASINHGLKVYPAESSKLNSSAGNLFKSSGNVTVNDFNLHVLENREDFIFSLIDKFAPDKKQVIVSFGLAHDFSNNVKKYNESESAKKYGKFCLNELIPVGVDFNYGRD